MNTTYSFTSERLGFRRWASSDLEPMHTINSDPEVMRFFPEVKTKEETRAFISRMQAHQNEKGYCFFAVDNLEKNNLIGFIGLHYIDYVADFTPSVEIGWRLSRSEWGKGYATEGAKRCLSYASDDLQLKEICAIAPEINKKSEAVMIRIGMNKIGYFNHPLLTCSPKLEKCILYKVFS